VKQFDIGNIEEAAAESERDRQDLASLKVNLEELLKHEDAMRVPVAVRRLIDLEVDPVVIAKTLVIGDRDGGLLYQLSARTPALHRHESITREVVALAIRDVREDVAATMLVSGAVWLAEQFKIDRTMLASFVTSASKRPMPANRRGAGAIDLVDHDGLGNRAWLVDAIEKAQLPSFAPLEFSRGRS
jgi:hypothetical protein